MNRIITLRSGGRGSNTFSNTLESHQLQHPQIHERFNELNARYIIERQFFFALLYPLRPSLASSSFKFHLERSPHLHLRTMTMIENRVTISACYLLVRAARSLSLAETRREKAHVTREQRQSTACFLPTASGSSTYLAESSLGTRRRRAATSNPLPFRRSDSTYRQKGGRAGTEGERLVERTSVGWTLRLNPRMTVIERPG